MSDGGTTIRSLRAEHAEATRAALLTSARALFGSRGYDETSTEDIVRAAGVTKGALYHHFPDKRSIFVAVCEQVEAEWFQEVISISVPVDSAWRRLMAGCEAFLEGCARPEIRQILLLDGPAVLGLDDLHEINSSARFKLVSAAIEAAIEEAELTRREVEPLAHLLIGALRDAGLAVARAEDPKQERLRMIAAIDWVLAALKPRNPR